jgi:hypothetical protein
LEFTWILSNMHIFMSLHIKLSIISETPGIDKSPWYGSVWIDIIAGDGFEVRRHHRRCRAGRFDCGSFLFEEGVDVYINGGESVRCRYLFGADGARSIVAQSLLGGVVKKMGMALEGEGRLAPGIKGGVPSSISISAAFQMGTDGFSPRVISSP